MSVLIWWISHCCVYWHQWIIPFQVSMLRRYSNFSPFQEHILTSGPENRELSQHQERSYPAPAHVFSFRRPQLNPCHFNVHNSLMEAHLALDRRVQCQPLDCVCHMLESCFLLCGGFNLDDTEDWKWNIVSWCLAESEDENPEGMGKWESTEWTVDKQSCW